VKPPTVYLDTLLKFLAGDRNCQRLLATQKRHERWDRGYYWRHRHAIRSCLMPGHDMEWLSGQFSYLWSEDWQRELARKALEQFLKLREEGQLPATLAPRCSQQPVYLGGAAIVVGPDLSSAGGHIRFHFHPDLPLSDEKAGYIGALLQELPSLRASPDRRPHPEASAVIDLPRGRVFRGPRKRSDRLDEIEAACEVLVREWGNSDVGVHTS
jgi:hypothetical protein